MILSACMVVWEGAGWNDGPMPDTFHRWKPNDGRISGPLAKARLEGKQISFKIKFVWDNDREYFRKIK